MIYTYHHTVGASFIWRGYLVKVSNPCFNWDVIITRLDNNETCTLKMPRRLHLMDDDPTADAVHYMLRHGYTGIANYKEVQAPYEAYIKSQSAYAQIYRLPMILVDNYTA